MASNRRRMVFLAALFCVALRAMAWLGAAPPDFQNELWIPNLNEPTVITFLPDGRLLAAQRDGVIRLALPGANQLQPAPLLTLTNIDITGGERGLVGLTPDTDFTTNGYIYAFYTAASPLRDRVSRFTVSGNTASLASELVLWQDDVAAGEFHHGGTVAIGPDGFLYISTGDHNGPQDSPSLTSYHGKILRISRTGGVPSGTVGDKRGRPTSGVPPHASKRLS